MIFTEELLEVTIMELLGDQALIKDGLRAYIANRYVADEITNGEIDSVILQLEPYL